MANTPRWSLPYPAGTDPPNGPQELHDLALALDDVAKDDQGTLASRPVSSGGSPGKKGRYYMVKGDATASNNNILWRDNGTGWDQVGGGGTLFDVRANRPAANAVPVGTRFFATNQIAEWISDGAAWIRIGAQAGEAAMTFVAAATPGKILLQGQAWPSTVGIYAELFAILGGATLPDMRQRVPAGYKAGDADMGALLAVGGEKTHVLTIAELPTFTVEIPSGTTAAGGPGISPPTGPDSGGGYHSRPLGGGTAHNNLQPFIVVNFEAKL